MNLTNLPEVLFSKHIMPFVGDESFLFIAGVCRLFRDTYQSYLRQQEQELKMYTSLTEIVSSVSRLHMVMNEVNNIDVHLPWWYDTTGIFSRSIIKCAVYNGNLDVLIWIKSNNTQRWKAVCQRFPVCEEAVKNGKLMVLQWLRSQEGGNCLWDEETCAYIIHLEIFEWARKNGCPYNGE